MNGTEELIALGCVTSFYAWFFCSTIWGDLARKTYRARMHPAWRWFLMPTKRDRNEEKWIHDQTLFMWVSLPFFALVMIMFVVSILRAT